MSFRDLLLILTAWTALSFIAGPFLAALIGRAEAWHRDGERYPEISQINHGVYHHEEL